MNPVTLAELDPQTRAKVIQQIGETEGTTALATVSSQSETVSLSGTDSQTIVNHIVETMSTAMVGTLQALEPYIQEIWRRLDAGEVIRVGKDEYHTRKDFCRGVLGRTYRAVHYMLQGGNQNRTPAVPPPAPTLVSERAAGKMSAGWNGYHQTELTPDDVANLKVGDVLLCYKGKTQPYLLSVHAISPKQIRMVDGQVPADWALEHPRSVGNIFPTAGECYMRCWNMVAIRIATDADHKLVADWNARVTVQEPAEPDDFQKTINAAQELKQDYPDLYDRVIRKEITLAAARLQIRPSPDDLFIAVEEFFQSLPSPLAGLAALEAFLVAYPEYRNHRRMAGNAIQLYEDWKSGNHHGGNDGRDGLHRRTIFHLGDISRQKGPAPQDLPNELNQRPIPDAEFVDAPRPAEPETPASVEPVNSWQPDATDDCMPVYTRATEPSDMCALCIEHPHKITERPFDYSMHPELQTQTASRSHGMGLERLRTLAAELNVACAIKYDDGFKITCTYSFASEGEAKQWLQTQPK